MFEPVCESPPGRAIRLQHTLERGKPIARRKEYNVDNWVAWLALSAGGELVASRGARGAVGVDDVAAGRTVWTFETGAVEVTCVEFLPDGSGVRTCGSDGFIRRWSLATGMEERRWKTPYTRRLKTFGSLDGSRFIVTNGRALELWSDEFPEPVIWRRDDLGGSVDLPCFCDAHARVLYLGDEMTYAGQFLPTCCAVDAATGEYVGGASHFFRGHFCVLQDTRRGPLTLLHGRGGLNTYSARGGYDGIIVIEEWGLRRRQTLPDRGRKSGLARFSIDGRRIATTNGTHVDLYQLLPEPGWVGTVDLSQLGDPVEVMALSDDGAVLTVGTRRGRVLVFVVEG